jgi:hypothetical protein
MGLIAVIERFLRAARLHSFVEKQAPEPDALPSGLIVAALAAPRLLRLAYPRPYILDAPYLERPRASPAASGRTATSCTHRLAFPNMSWVGWSACWHHLPSRQRGRDGAPGVPGQPACFYGF